VVYWVVRGVLVITSSLEVPSAKFEAAEQRTQNDTNLASCECSNSHRITTNRTHTGYWE
jgi:hypothetical protein